MYEAALREYRRGSYDAAVTRFDGFLRWHPDDENVFLATSLRNLSQVRSAAGATTEPPLRALELAEKVLTPADALVGDEYEETMADLAERFITAAKATPVINEKEYLIGYAERAMALIPPNYNPQ